MKKFLYLIAATAFIVACNTEQKPAAETSAAEVTKPKAALPYEASYSSSFEIGNHDYSAMIVQGSWKDWEDNKLDNMVNWLADSIVAYQSDNDVVVGAATLMADWKKGRATYTSVKPTLDAVIPVYSTDKKENWVLVWATEIDTRADGTVDTVSLMETWRINAEGKADLLYQYDRKNRKK